VECEEAKRQPDEETPFSSWRLLWDMVLIRPVKPLDVTPGGIVLPERAKEVSQVGEVLQTGPGVRDSQVKQGDHVLFHPWVERANWGGEEYIIGPIEEIIIAVVPRSVMVDQWNKAETHLKALEANLRVAEEDTGDE